MLSDIFFIRDAKKKNLIFPSLCVGLGLISFLFFSETSYAIGEEENTHIKKNSFPAVSKEVNNEHSPQSIIGPNKQSSRSLEANLFSTDISARSEKSDLQWIMILFAGLVIVGSFSSKSPSKKKPVRLCRIETIQTEE